MSNPSQYQKPTDQPVPPAATPPAATPLKDLQPINDLLGSQNIVKQSQDAITEMNKRIEESRLPAPEILGLTTSNDKPKANG